MTSSGFMFTEKAFFIVQLNNNLLNSGESLKLASMTLMNFHQFIHNWYLSSENRSEISGILLLLLVMQ
jgi:hypothetical protein